MLLLTTVALLMTSALALPTGAGDSGMTGANMAMPTAPCCTPPRWQASMFDLKADSGLTYVTEYAQDETMQAEGSVTMNRLTTEIVSQTFTDYKTKMTYTVNMYGDKMGQCVSSKVGHDFYSSCNTKPAAAAMPSNILGFQYEGNATLGGPKGLMYDAWNIQFSDGLNVTISLTRDMCIPVLENVKYDTPSGPVESLLLFNDVTTNVDDKLLTMPAACAATSGGVVG